MAKRKKKGFNNPITPEFGKTVVLKPNAVKKEPVKEIKPESGKWEGTKFEESKSGLVVKVKKAPEPKTVPVVPSKSNNFMCECTHSKDMHYGPEGKTWCNVTGCNCQKLK